MPSQCPTRSSSRILAALFGATVLASVASAQTDRPPPMLQPGDALRISVWRDTAMSGQFTIAGDGTLMHPLYRSIKVGGLPLPDVESRIRTFLQRYQTEPQFVAEPLVRITVIGEAERPSLYFVSPALSITQAVSLAGGASQRGRADRVTLITGGRARVINLDGRDPAENLPVRSGDQLVIERRRDILREIIAPLIGIAGSIAAILVFVDRNSNP